MALGWRRNSAAHRGKSLNSWRAAAGGSDSGIV